MGGRQSSWGTELPATGDGSAAGSDDDDNDDDDDDDVDHDAAELAAAGCDAPHLSSSPPNKRSSSRAH